MKVVILCGGQGTRLREETEHKPKALVPIGGRPILWHILKHYSLYGFNDFVICLGYKGDLIRDYFLNFAPMNCDIEMDLSTNSWRPLGRDPLPNWKITLAETGLNSMTGGRLLRVKDYLKNEPFMMTYGDAVCTVNLNNLEKFHRREGRLATVTGVPPLPRFGELQIQDGRVVRFSEKPDDQGGLINGGYFVLEPGIFDYLEDDQTIFERAPLEALAAAGQLGLFPHTGFWHCMDTYRDYNHLNALWDSGERPWKIWDGN